MIVSEHHNVDVHYTNYDVVTSYVTGPVKTGNVGTHYTIKLNVISEYRNRIFAFCNFHHKAN